MSHCDGRIRARIIFCELLLAWVIAGAASAQGVGDVSGVVTDDEGIPLAGAFVKAAGRE